MGYEYIQEADAWLRLHLEPATWADARMRCRDEGGVLASPTSRALAQQMVSTMVTNNLMWNSIFTGISAVISKGHFTTLDGIPIANLSLEWADGEPNNLNDGEDCLVLKGLGQLADVSCGSVHPFFCRKESAKMTLNKCGITDSEYKMASETGSCYKFHTNPRPWHQAASACSSEGGHLAVINSPKESQVLKALFNTHPDNSIHGVKYTHVAMIGFWDWNEHGRNGEWLTIFGQTLTEAGFDTWAEHEPNNAYGIEYCGSIVRNGLNDFECNRSAVFICERTP